MVIELKREIKLLKRRKRKENITVRRIGRKAKGLETVEEKEHRKAILSDPVRELEFFRYNQVREGFD